MTMLRKIISITGKPGLFRMIGQGNRRLIVEDITTGKRFPALERDRIISLGDIAMYTVSEDKPLGEILDLIYEKHNGEQLDVKEIVAAGKLRDTFREVLPDFDDDRVHDSDIKKLFSWYNLLVASGMKKFTEEENAEAPAEEKAEETPKAEEKKEETKEEKPKAKKAPAKKAPAKKTAKPKAEKKD